MTSSPESAEEGAAPLHLSFNSAKTTRKLLSSTILFGKGASESTLESPIDDVQPVRVILTPMEEQASGGFQVLLLQF